MKTGMLWFDNDPQLDLPNKITRAAAYYQKKYGQKPNLCFVHPSMLSDKSLQEGFEIRPTKMIMPNHIWIGIDELI
jgi:hypothetical protein